MLRKEDFQDRAEGKTIHPLTLLDLIIEEEVNRVLADIHGDPDWRNQDSKKMSELYCNYIKEKPNFEKYLFILNELRERIRRFTYDAAKNVIFEIKTYSNNLIGPIKDKEENIIKLLEVIGLSIGNVNELYEYSSETHNAKKGNLCSMVYRESMYATKVRGVCCEVEYVTTHLGGVEYEENESREIIFKIVPNPLYGEIFNNGKPKLKPIEN